MNESSWIDNISYDSATKSLSIDTKSGEAYTYSGVSQTVANNMAEANSLGRFHNENLRGQYDCVKG